MPDSFFAVQHEFPPQPAADSSAPWTVHARGYLVIGNQIVDATSLAARNEFQSQVAAPEAERLNGSFAAVMISPDGGSIWLLTDPVGSLPLYFAVRGRQVVCGSDGLAVARACEELHFAPAAIAQLVAFGYTLGEQTIFEEVREVTGATCVQLRWDPQRQQVTTVRQRYWRYQQHPTLDANGFSREFDNVAALLKDRYGAYLAKSELPPLVHLSAGGDSRLLLAWFADAPRLATATYGSARSKDAFVARSLARQAGVAAHYAVPISGREAVTSSLRDVPVALCGLRCHPSQCLGPELLRSQMPPGDWNHLLGHAADFVAGSHMRDHHFAPHSPDERVRKILAAHSFPTKFRMTDNVDDVLRLFSAPEMFTDPIAEELDTTRDAPPWLAFHIWNLENRQRRYILSHGVVTRDWGQPMLPFWDLDFVRLFESCEPAVLQNTLATYGRKVQQSSEQIFRRPPRVEWQINRVSTANILRESISTGTPDRAVLLFANLALGRLRRTKARKRAGFAWFAKISDPEAERAIASILESEPILAEILTPEGKSQLTRQLWISLFDACLLVSELKQLLPQIASSRSGQSFDAELHTRR